MRAVFVSTGSATFDDFPNPSYGVATQLWPLSKEFAKDRNEVHLIGGGRKTEVSKIDNVIIKRFKVLSSNNVLIEYFSRLYFSFLVCVYCLKIKPEIIFIRDRLAGFFPSFLSIPIVYTIPSLDSYDFHKKYSFSINKLNYINFYLKNIIEKIVLINADRIIVMNDFMKDYLKSKGFKKVEKIFIGIELEKINNTQRNEEFILYVGRLDWNKNVKLLIEAFSLILGDYEIKLKLVGDGNKMSELVKLTKKLNLENYVEFLPRCSHEEVLEYIARCNIFVLPSIIENSSNVLLEAMGSGKAVIASDTMGPKELITQGQNGLIFRNNDKEDLKRCLDLILRDNRFKRKIENNAERTVKEHYTIEKIAERYKSINLKYLNRW